MFTFPDTTDNRLGLGQVRFNLIATTTFSIQANGYYRDLERRTLNGDEAEFALCEADALSAGAPVNTLCRGTREDNADPGVDVLTGRFITDDDASGDGAFNRSLTRSKGYGATVQATSTRTLAGRDNVLIFGSSADLADVWFSSNSEVGTLTAERTVNGSGLFAGIYGMAPDDEFNTAIDIENRSLGFYFSNTLSATDRLHVTLAG